MEEALQFGGDAAVGLFSALALERLRHFASRRFVAGQEQTAIEAQLQRVRSAQCARKAAFFRT